MSQNLTDLSVQKLPEGTHFDGKLRNFGIRVGKNRRTWIVVKGDNRTKVTLGHYPALSLADARKRAQETFVAPTHTKPRISFPDALTAFLALPRWRESTRTVMRSTLKPFTWKKQIHLITHEDVVQVLEGIEKPSARHHAQKDIKTFFNWCIPRYLDHSPCIGLRTETQPSRARYLTNTELKAVWNACTGTFGIIVRLLILTGQRRGEIGNLHSDYIDGGVITLPAEVVKNNRTHTFPLGPLAQSLLPNTTGYLFGQYKDFTRQTKALRLACGVPDFSLHDIRRTYSTIHAELGTPLHITEQLLNHRSGTISGVASTYNRYSYAKEMREAVLLYEQHIVSVVAG